MLHNHTALNCGFEVKQKKKGKKMMIINAFFRCFSHPVICRHRAAIAAAVWQSNPEFLVGLGKEGGNVHFSALENFKSSLK